jgi:hypothetical protein
MSAGHVGFTALQRQQTANATDIGSGDFKLRVKLLELIFDDPDRKIVTAGAENRVFDIFSRPKQLNLSFFAFV